MSVIRFNHPTVDSDGNPMPFSTVQVMILDENESPVRVFPRSGSSGEAAEIHLGFDAPTAARIRSVRVVTEGGQISPSEPVFAPAPPEGIQPTKAGGVTNLTFSNS